MKNKNKNWLSTCLMILAISALTVWLGVTMRQSLISNRQRETDYILHFYSEIIVTQLKDGLNEAKALAQIAGIADGVSVELFENAASPLLERKEVCYIYLFDGDTLVSAFPKEETKGQLGKDLRDFSYIYTMTKVTKDSVVEGPVVMDLEDGSQEVFLFLEPIAKNGVYLGEVAVALDSAYVMEQLNLDYLSQSGYDYELWRVDPQNGSKEVMAVSMDTVDFSHGAKISFYLPTQWNLSVQPKGGWISLYSHIVIIFLCLLMDLLLLLLLSLLQRQKEYRIKLKLSALLDIQTGLYNQIGFTAMLDEWLVKDSPVALFYLVFEGYNQVAQLIGPEEEEAFLRSIPERLRGFIKGPYIAGRLESGNFAVAVIKEMSEEQREIFARGLSLELLLKTNLNGKKLFLNAQYQHTSCLPQAGGAAKEISNLVQAYYARLSEESPVRMLTEKCRQLIEGRGDVTFDEYTDLEMMDLSKTFNQYRKQVEQLAYFDPMFNVGNRQKYLRDANMLISYDKKRQFHLYCVDIREFSQYNELFSAEVGDSILLEVINRLSRLFGSYLYRINGDVFLGLSLSSESEEAVAEKIQEILTKPATIGNASLALRVRVVVCQYPVHGSSPELLLEHIQSAVRYAKANGRKTVIYNEELDELFRTEADILHRLKSGIKQNTMEVWFQPIMNLEAGRFTSVEALMRLPDGQGGYYSAAQVISLAERSSIIEDLGDYVLRHACQFMHGWGEKLGIFRMGINLSVQQILLDNSAEHLLEMIREEGVSTDKITLEITESVLIQSIEQASVTLDKIREAGIHVALDDFGVGYSSLNYLSNLPVDVLKIDRSLTKQIATSPKQRALLHAIVEMAKINSLAVVAEGCEDSPEKEIISDSGVQFIQGYYYSRPLPEAELIRFLKEYQRR